MQIFFNVLASLGALGAAIEGWFTWSGRSRVDWTFSSRQGEPPWPGGVSFNLDNTGNANAYDVRLTLCGIDRFTDTKTSSRVDAGAAWQVDMDGHLLQYMREVRVEWRRRPVSRKLRHSTVKVQADELQSGIAVPLFPDRLRLRVTREPPARK